MPAIDGSGELLCRLLVELVAVEPASTACDSDLTPLKAELTWPDHGHVAFEVQAITRRQDLPFGELFVPPAEAELSRGHAAAPTERRVPQPERPGLVPLAGGPPANLPPKEAPGEGLLAINHTDTLRYVMLDGVAVAWVKPHSQQFIIGPQSGSYVVSWRDFFGAQVDPPHPTELPARVLIGGEPDGGAPEPPQ